MSESRDFPHTIEAIRARLEAATPGPWSIYGRKTDRGRLNIGQKALGGDHVAAVHSEYVEADAALIAAAPTDLRLLLDENERLRRALALIDVAEAAKGLEPLSPEAFPDRRLFTLHITQAMVKAATTELRERTPLDPPKSRYTAAIGEVCDYAERLVAERDRLRAMGAGCS